MSLSSRIVQRGVATIREVEEALARQVLYGGDLVTNLLEVCRIDEQKLMPIVAEELGLPNAPFGELPRAPHEAQRMVAPEVALERAMAPLSMDHDGLVVAVAEPLREEDEQELAFALAVPIAQQIAPLVRIRQALARDYGVPLDKRLERLLARMNDGGPRTASSFPPERKAPEPKAPPRPPSKHPPPMMRAAEPVPRSTGTPETLLRQIEAPPARPTKRRRGPLTLDVATNELDSAPKSDAILDLLFEYSRQYFDYTALFLVKDDVAEGRDAYGEGAPRDLVARIGVPLDLPSLLAKARSDRRLVRGKGDPSGVDGVLAKDLGRKGNSEWVVVPVVVRKRVVALLLGDGGEGGIDDAGLDDVQAVTKHSVGAFERVLVRRKLKGSSPPSEEYRSSPPSQVPATQLSAEAKRPSVEELAAPIRELVNETQGIPSSSPKDTDRQPAAQMRGADDHRLPLSSTPSSPPVDRRSAPPPANVLAVRRVSGAPIPREEPTSIEMAAIEMAPIADLPVAKVPSNRPPPPSLLVPAIVSPGSSASPMPRSRSSSAALRRAVAPPLEFGSQPPPPVISPVFTSAAPSSAPTTTRDAHPPAITLEPPPPGPSVPPQEPFTLPPTSPKAESPPPPRPSSTTDPSPMSPFIPRPAKTLEIVDDEPSATPPPVEMDADATPAAPAVAPVAAAPVRVTSKLQANPVSGPPSPKPMPPSEQQISVAPHRPPSSRLDSSRGLPSVIVDTTSEYVAYVKRVMDGDDDEAEGELLRGGGAAMPAIMAQFPGPIAVERHSLNTTLPGRASDCGPIIRLVAAQRRTAVPYVLSLIDSDDPEKRFWATFLVTELVYADAIDAVVERVFDDYPRVRRAARAAARALAEAHPAAVVERLAPTVKDKIGKKDVRMLAIDALGETREPLAVVPLIPVLSDKSSEVAAAARAALSTVTRQDFGTDKKKWESWWEHNKARHRIEWLIDALTHEQSTIRAAAGEELKAITKEFFGYHDDLPKKERDKAQARYREWWAQVGRVRFNRATTRAT